MRDKPKLDLGLTAYDELFKDDKEIREGRLPKIYDIPPKEDGRYEIVSGHRRKKACEIAGLSVVKADVREMSRDEAIILMVESNLQRSTILPSEKAFSYKMRLEALKRQGKRTDLTSCPVGTKLEERSNQQVGNEVGDSARQVARYIRLTELIPDLLDLVDENQIALRPAVELSYLTKDEQRMVFEQILDCDCTPSHAQAIRMRRFSEEGKLSDAVIESIMQEEKPNQKEKIHIPLGQLRKYIPESVSYDTRKGKVKTWKTRKSTTQQYRKRKSSLSRHLQSSSRASLPEHLLHPAARTWLRSRSLTQIPRTSVLGKSSCSR